MNKNTFNLGEFTTLKQKQDVEYFQRQAKAYINSLPRVGQMAVNTITNTVWVITDICNMHSRWFFTVATCGRPPHSDLEYINFTNLLQSYIRRIMNGETDTEAGIEKILSTAPDYCRYICYNNGLEVALFNGEQKKSIGLLDFCNDKIGHCFQPSKNSCYDWVTTDGRFK